MKLLSMIKGLFTKKPDVQEVSNKITLPNGRVAVVDEKGNFKGWDVVSVTKK